MYMYTNITYKQFVFQELYTKQILKNGIMRRNLILLKETLKKLHGMDNTLLSIAF